MVHPFSVWTPECGRGCVFTFMPKYIQYTLEIVKYYLKCLLLILVKPCLSGGLVILSTDAAPTTSMN